MGGSTRAARDRNVTKCSPDAGGMLAKISPALVVFITAEIDAAARACMNAMAATNGGMTAVD